MKRLASLLVVGWVGVLVALCAAGRVLADPPPYPQIGLFPDSYDDLDRQNALFFSTSMEFVWAVVGLGALVLLAWWGPRLGFKLFRRLTRGVAGSV